MSISSNSSQVPPRRVDPRLRRTIGSIRFPWSGDRGLSFGWICISCGAKGHGQRRNHSCLKPSKFLRLFNRPIFLCHGCFDLLHIGHLEHLIQVRKLADQQHGIVCVSITGDEFVAKGPGRPLMPEQERAAILWALKCVDRVVICPFHTAVNTINAIKPRYYCKGPDYCGKESTDPNLAVEIRAVRAIGGDILYTTSPIHHSTDYLERYRNAFNR